MKLHSFVRAVAALHFEDTFNPYRDRCLVHDHAAAPQKRAEALSRMVEKAQANGVDSLWIGRDLGYRGGRRTGMALTDDVHMECHARRWEVIASRPTIGEAVAERTAAVVWRMLNRIDAKVFLWNVFPLHPHNSGEPFSNRQHNATERRAGEEILSMLLDLLRPSRIVAIGNDAAATGTRVTGSIPVLATRHPSYGGQRQFEQQITGLYDLKDDGVIIDSAGSLSLVQCEDSGYGRPLRSVPCL